MNPPATRPALDERRTYTPRARQERFIVPLLDRAIHNAITTYASAPAQGDRALDVGCGGQPLRHHLESRGWTYVGLDTQPQPGITTDYICAIDQPLPAPLAMSTGFAFILCTEVLEHVGDWSTAFQNLSALLKPGGRLLITCPHVYPLHEQPFDFWRPTPFALRLFAQRVGLEVIEEKRLGTAWDVLGTILGAAAPAPATRGPFSLIAAALARPVRSTTIALLTTGLLQRLIKPKGDVYLSNLVVLRKPLDQPTPGPA